jgi:hypothetical protein
MIGVSFGTHYRAISNVGKGVIKKVKNLTRKSSGGHQAKRRKEGKSKKSY